MGEASKQVFRAQGCLQNTFLQRPDPRAEMKKQEVLRSTDDTRNSLGSSFCFCAMTQLAPKDLEQGWPSQKEGQPHFGT